MNEGGKQSICYSSQVDATLSCTFLDLDPRLVQPAWQSCFHMAATRDRYLYQQPVISANNRLQRVSTRPRDAEKAGEARVAWLALFSKHYSKLPPASVKD